MNDSTTTTINKEAVSSDPKQDARSSRLSIKKMSEDKLRKELVEIAQAKCKDFSQAFSDCAQREGLKVVVSCRTECRQMKECIAQYYNEEEFEKYLISKGFDPNSTKKKGMFYPFF